MAVCEDMPHTVATTGADVLPSKARIAFLIKWVASVVQIGGYTATAFDWTPWNIYLFLFGLLGWLSVGVLWNDRAIILIHVIALVMMIAGSLS